MHLQPAHPRKVEDWAHVSQSMVPTQRHRTSYHQQCPTKSWTFPHYLLTLTAGLISQFFLFRQATFDQGPERLWQNTGK